MVLYLNNVVGEWNLVMYCVDLKIFICIGEMWVKNYVEN